MSEHKATAMLYGPKEKVHCGMIRGLISPWKQLIYYEFDTLMTKDVLHAMIEKVETSGF